MAGFRIRNGVCATGKIELLFGNGVRRYCCGVEALLAKAGLADFEG